MIYNNDNLTFFQILPYSEESLEDAFPYFRRSYRNKEAKAIEKMEG